jgi:hypothetical protein
MNTTNIITIIKLNKLTKAIGNLYGRLETLTKFFFRNLNERDTLCERIMIFKRTQNNKNVL